MNSNHPLISVIMPVYNGAKYLSEAIDSILNQTYTNFELIIVDDGSTDESLAILQKYALQDTRIRLFCNQINSKTPKTLNLGIKHAKGKYIARMDQDDISLPLRFNKQVNFMENNLYIDVCGSWMYLMDQSKTLINLPDNHQRIKIIMYLFDCAIAHPTVIMRTKLFHEDGFRYYEENADTAEDYCLWIKMLERGIQFANFQEPLLLYRIHESQFTKIYAGNIDASNRQIITIGLRAIFQNDLTTDIINTHLNLFRYSHKKKFIRRICMYKIERHIKSLLYYNNKNKILNHDILYEELIARSIVNKIILQLTRIRNTCKSYLKLMIKKLGQLI